MSEEVVESYGRGYIAVMVIVAIILITTIGTVGSYTLDDVKNVDVLWFDVEKIKKNRGDE